MERRHYTVAGEHHIELFYLLLGIFLLCRSVPVPKDRAISHLIITCPVMSPDDRVVLVSWQSVS